MAFTVTNNLDDVAIYIGLTRLPGETDELFATRIKRFANIRYGTDYATSVKSITEQIGLKMAPVARVSGSVPFSFNISSENIEITTFPINGTREYCKIFINYSDNTEDFSLRIQERVSALQDISVSIINQDGFSSLNRENLFRSTSTKLIQAAIGDKRNIINDKILPGTIRSISPYMVRQKESSQDLRYIGDYFVDYELSYIELQGEPQNVFGISYRNYEEDVILYKTEFNLIPINSYMKYGISDNFISLMDEYLKGKGLG